MRTYSPKVISFFAGLSILMVTAFCLGPLQSAAQVRKTLGNVKIAKIDTSVIKEAVLSKPALTLQLPEQNGIQNIQLSPAQLRLDTAQNFKVVRTGDKIKEVNSEIRWPSANRSAKVYALPTVYVARLEGNKTSILRPIFIGDKKMRYDEDTQSFVGSISIVMEDPDNSQVQRNLVQPVTIQVFSDVDQTLPATVSFTHTNIPAQTVEFREDNPRDSIRFKLVTPFDNQGYQASLGVEPSIFIDQAHSGDRELLGLGLEAVPIQIRLQGASLNGDSVQVSLEANPGAVTPSTVFIKSGQATEVWLRSKGLGEASLRANSSYGDASRSFRYVMPWLFFLLAVLGGLLGAMIHPLVLRSQNKDVHFLPFILGGIIAGLILSAAYSLGFSNLIEKFSHGLIPSYSSTNEMLIFVVAGIAGLGWSYLKSMLFSKSD